MTSTPARGEAQLDAEITRFGETLAAHDFVPTPQHDEALLVAYASALDAYEAAKRVRAAARTAAEADVAVRHALAEGHQALADLDALRKGRPVRRREEQGSRHTQERTRRAGPADRPAQSRVVHLQSPGPKEFAIAWDPATPAVLVVRAVSHHQRLSTRLQRLRRGAGSVRPHDVLLKAGGDFTARLPIPMVGGGEESARFRISNDAVAGAPFDPLAFDVDRIPYWEVWMEPSDTCRTFTTSISGEGWDVVHYTGSRATARFTCDSRRGEVVVQQLNSQFQAVGQLFRGHRSVTDGELIVPAKAAWLAVRCHGTWSLTTSPDPPDRGM